MMFLLAIASLAVFAFLFAEIEQLHQQNEVLKARLQAATSKKEAAGSKVLKLSFDKVIAALQLQQLEKDNDDLQLQIFEAAAKLRTADHRIHLLRFHFVLEELELFEEARRQAAHAEEDQPTPTKPAAGIDYSTESDEEEDTETEEEEEQASFEDLMAEGKQQDLSYIDDILDAIDPRLQQYWDLASGESPVADDEDFFIMRGKGPEDLPEFDDLKYLDDIEEEEEECEDDEDVQPSLEFNFVQPRIVGPPCSKFMAAQLHWANNSEIV
eukprot:CAMPEP_0197521710 /NCGR_PEP_ID=MMETSP1318-20131121/6958_1 /TAXON_ID=552666 /ORGANISM="Partenskyella glossopodia, Strain RCC365" /LENGTH=268 /DNA_ID=CAMNT_0043073815 /DNA_START=51 /DNA_END=857 /DNA_ORIENTATION=+